MRRYSIRAWEEYKMLRNEYIKICREEEIKFENNVNKCRAEPKLFYIFINSKIKAKDHILRLKVGGEMYEEVRNMCEIMNNSFQSALTKMFVDPDTEARPPQMEEIK